MEEPQGSVANKVAAAGRGRGAPTLQVVTLDEEELRGLPYAVSSVIHPCFAQRQTSSNLDQTHARCVFEATNTELASLSDFLSEFLLLADQANRKLD